MQTVNRTREGYKLVKSDFGQRDEIPENWQLKSLNEIGSIIGGGTPDSKNKEYWDGDIPWAVPTDLTNLNVKFIKDTERYITRKGLESSAARILPPHSVLITSRATIGECAINEVPMSTNQGFQNLICNSSNDYQFMFYAIKFHRPKLLKFAYGTTFLEITKNNMKKVKIPCPPLAEQQKISSILSKVDDLIVKIDAIIKQTQRLKKGLMQKLFKYGVDDNGRLRDPVKNPEVFRDTKAGLVPKEWAVCSLGEMITLQRGFDITNKDVVQGNVPIISSSGITAYHNIGMANGPGVITGRKGTLGRVFYIEGPYWAHDTTLWVRDFHGNNPKFAFRFLENMRHERFNASTANPTLNRNTVHPITVAFPSVHEQKRIAEIIETLHHQVVMSSAYRESVRSLKRGLMQKLLTGKIRVKV